MPTRSPRKSVTVTPAASRHLDAIPHQGSESALLAEALERGLEAMADEARDEGYRQLVEVFETDPEERAIRDALRARRGSFRGTAGHEEGNA